MSKTVRKFHFIDAWRIGENESWLSDMASQGLHLSKFGRIFARFDRGEPQKYRYRIDISFSELTDDYTAMFTECGWEFVSSTNGFNVFRSPESSDAPELHTDPAEQSFTLRKLSQRFIISTSFFVLAAILSFFTIYFTISVGNTPILRLIEGSGLGMLIILPNYIYASIISLQAAFSIKKLMRSMRLGYPINHKANWKRYKRSGIITLIVVIVFSSVSIVTPFLQIISRRNETLPLVNDNQMILRLSDIEDSVNLERTGSFIQQNVDWGNKVSFHWSLFAPIQFNVNESGIIKGQYWPDMKGEYSPTLEYRLFKLRIPYLADSLLNDLTNRMSSWYSIHNESPDIIEIKSSGIDKLLVRESDFYREVFAYKESYVVYIRYYGEKSIDSVTDAVLNLMDGL